MKSIVLAAVAMAGLATGAHAAPAFEYTGNLSLSENRNFTLGFAFSLSEAMTIDQLGYNTFNFTRAQTIGLWTIGGELITSTTVLPTDPISGHFAYHDITDILLGPGSYILAGTYTGGSVVVGLTGVTTLPGYTYLRELQNVGSGLLLPTYASPTGGLTYGNQAFALVNFTTTSAVPEPATWAMMIGGFSLVGATMRRRRATVSYA